MTNARSAWDLESGLKQSFDMTISSATFEYDSSYKADVLLLVLKGIDTDGDEQRLLYTVSQGWVPGQGGQTAVREDGQQGRSFNKNSGIGTLITAARTAMATEGADLVSRGSGQPRDASIWPGLTFPFERTPLGEGDYKTERPLPVKFLGEGQTTQAAQAQPVGTNPAPAAPAAPATNGGTAVAPITMAKL